ncbi:MAG: hypothetical protein OEY56_12870, partial [Cyclobacteriaceae bacterium]|nr:hypothetical protein [Cyclobacteriaceae bacterium]
DTSRLQSDINPMGAVITLCRCVGLRVNVQGIIWTCLHTRLTPNAAIIIEINNAIRPCVECFRWTNGDTGCIRTMVTPGH